MKRIFIPTLTILLAILLASCGGTTAPVSTDDTYTSPNLPADYDDALSARNQLALGIIELNQTDLAPASGQAQALLPLWQALRGTQQSGGAAQAETNALLAQIEAAMLPEQLQAIAEMQLTFTDMQDWASANGITLGNSGGMSGGSGSTPGQGQGMSPEARATKQAEQGITSSDGGSGSNLSSALIDAVIALLEARIP
ncbi:MAG: hypothetical protein FD146_2339 [Anaerolineaceae bacterium]|nr:MAG: hypothetical protein FD146_2339 [Anaerolineaceae bacterium]